MKTKHYEAINGLNSCDFCLKVQPIQGIRGVGVDKVFRFLSLTLVLFLLFAAGWVWFTGDKRLLQASYWEDMLNGPTMVQKSSPSDKSVAVATLTGNTATATKPKTADAMTTAITRIAAPEGRYVTAKLGGPSSASSASSSAEALATIAAISSPSGRYVEAPKMTMAAKPAVAHVIERISTPAGRYVTAAATSDAPAKFEIVGSPAGRYVDAPAIEAPTAPIAKITPVGSPAGRYVDAPAMEAPTTAPIAKITPVGSPAGRYVDAPVMEAATTTSVASPAEVTAVGSPPGRYVDAPKAAPLKSATGALVFPITFEYRKATFTTKGREAADQLLQHVLSKKYKDITLSGHTDSRGSDRINLKISDRRLKTVAKHLKEGGYKGGINLIPKGKSEPFTGIDRSKYTEEQLYDFDRRVELVEGK